MKPLQMQDESFIRFHQLSIGFRARILYPLPIQFRMGNKHSAQPPQPITPQALEESCQFLVKHQSPSYTKQQVKPHVQAILQAVRQSQPIQKQSDHLVINKSYLKFIFCQYFSRQMMKMVQLLVTLLENLNGKSLTFLKIQQIVCLANIADFILYFSNEKILENFDSLLVRSDVDEETKNLLREIEKQHSGELEINGNIVEKMNPEEQEMIEKCLRVTIMNFINLRLKPVSRSDTTLRYFAYFQQSLFMLYAKVYFAHHGGQRQPNVAELNQHFKSNLTIGAYFLSSGTSYVQPSLYEAAVVFIYSFLKLKGVQNKEVKNLPSHMFKNLPIIATHSIYQYILCNLLFSLKYIKEGGQNYVRFAFNRIFSYKLIEELLKKHKLSNKIFTYYFEQLCLQVKIGQIERACLCGVIELYLKNNQGQIKSEIFDKFVEAGKVKYNLKFTDRQIKVSKQQLLTELEDDEDTCKKQYYLISYKFILEKVLRRVVNYNFNDKNLWQEILPNLINSKEDEGRSMKQDLSDRYYGKQEDFAKKQHISVLEQQEDNHAEKVQ